MSEIKALRGLSILQHDYCLSDQCIERMDKLADEIQAEVDSRFMELPVDAEGIPIHVGDRIEYPNGEPTINESGWFASKCHHNKPRTVEDVIRDAVVYGISVEDAAEEIRGMMADESR